MWELYVQARQFANEKYPNDIVDYVECKVTKFSELIVQDCELAMNRMPRYAKTKQFQDIENATIDDCIMAVKQNFGIE